MALMKLGDITLAHQLEILEFEAHRLMRDLVIFGENLPDAEISNRSDFILTARESLNAYFGSIGQLNNK